MLRRSLAFLAAGAALVILTVGPASAAETQPTPGAAPATTIAVAIGQLKEADGGIASIDLRAAARDGHTVGTLHFYSVDDGYYNGVVRTLTVTNGAISATGGGGLVQPDGTRVPVQFTAEISADGQQVSIVVHGPRGVQYTLAGRLDPGIVKTGPGTLRLNGHRSALPAAA